MVNSEQFLTSAQAAKWASKYLDKNVTNNNIMYLINYGKIANHSDNGLTSLVNIDELKEYYDKNIKTRLYLDSPLSFAKYKEAETTKHIHRLHPYKGKFIPQLAEYFLDLHVDELKRNTYFKENDIIIDPFCGSGTTLCVANELGINAIGIDVSAFNVKLSNAKIRSYNLDLLKYELEKIISSLETYVNNSNILLFDEELSRQLSFFNANYFPAKTYKRKIILKEIDELEYSKDKLEKIAVVYINLINKYGVDISIEETGNFSDIWFVKSIREEIAFLKRQISQAPHELYDILSIILSRTARSCRATTHSDLATLIKPVNDVYYCSKHGRICKPLFTTLKWFKSYAKDTIKRLQQFNEIRTDSKQVCIHANSMDADIISELEHVDSEFVSLVCRDKIAGIFSSPPYVGMIDYHEQHAYAYDILELERNDKLEIGKLADGQSKFAQNKYVTDIAQVLINMKKYFKDDYNIFLVANDKYDLYPLIANMAQMSIVNRFERPVINRAEKDKNRYNESIFHLKEKL